MNIIFHTPTVTRKMRNEQNEHKSLVMWFTGLSGSGKSTLAHAVEAELHKLNCQTFVLDGDNTRCGLSVDLGFNDNDRKENIRRAGEVSKLMMEAGLIVIAAFISPFRKDRDMVRSLFQKSDFIEVYCKAPLEVCELRDVKGLYKKARAGKIENYTGIDSPYEPPECPELIIDTQQLSLQDSVKRVIGFLKSKDFLV